MAERHEPLVWFKSSQSAGANCVEVAATEDTVLMRHSRQPDGPRLALEPAAFARFVGAVKAGQFDRG